MSSFKRTVSGLSNLHSFHNADLIVFLEGGRESLTKELVYSVMEMTILLIFSFGVSYLINSRKQKKLNLSR